MRSLAWYYLGLCSGLVLGSLIRKRYDEAGWEAVKEAIEKNHKDRKYGHIPPLHKPPNKIE